MKTKDGWQSFLYACEKTKDKKMLDIFLKFILTPEEIEQIATRVLLIQDLLKGEMTQREIAKTHKVSIAKITRGSNALKSLDETHKKELIKTITQSGKKT